MAEPVHVMGGLDSTFASRRRCGVSNAQLVSLGGAQKSGGLLDEKSLSREEVSCHDVRPEPQMLKC